MLRHTLLGLYKRFGLFVSAMGAVLSGIALALKLPMG
jgi:hypothetical protein